MSDPTIHRYTISFGDEGECPITQVKYLSSNVASYLIGGEYPLREKVVKALYTEHPADEGWEPWHSHSTRWGIPGGSNPFARKIDPKKDHYNKDIDSGKTN